MDVSYQICNRCVMDTSDPDIRFDAAGNCNYCTRWLERLGNETYVDNPTRNIDQLLSSINEGAGGRDYDCIIGLSGGVDSSFVAYLVKKHGLRPLAVHLDNGWNSELAVDNIRTVLKALDVDLYTHVIEWDEFRDVQRSFFSASVPNVEIPTDHAINAVLQQAAVTHRVRHIITGGNVRGEGIYPRSWGWYNLDLRHLRAVHRRFGTLPLKTLPQLSLTQLAFNTFVRGIRTTPVLNYIDYNKEQAIETLVTELGWRPYGGKHYESVFTRFFQGYILPRKFKVDKRRAHFSPHVVAGTMSREDALAQLALDPYAAEDLRADYDFCLKKLGFTPEEFEACMRAPVRGHREYPTNAWFFDGSQRVKRLLKRVATRV